MPGLVLVGLGLCSAKYLNHCIDDSSAHMAGCPTPVGSPGMQVNPLVPARRTVILPWPSVSTTVAALATSGGAAESARAILVCEDSFELEPDDWSVCICAAAPEPIPAITRATNVATRTPELPFAYNIRNSSYAFLFEFELCKV